MAARRRFTLSERAADRAERGLLSFEQFEASLEEFGEETAFSALFGGSDTFIPDAADLRDFKGVAQLSFSCKNPLNASATRAALTFDRLSNKESRVQREEAFNLLSSGFAVQTAEELRESAVVLSSEDSDLSPAEATTLVRASLAERDRDRGTEESARDLVTQRSRARAAAPAPEGLSEGLLSPQHLARRRLLGGRNFFAP